MGNENRWIERACNKANKANEYRMKALETPHDATRERYLKYAAQDWESAFRLIKIGEAFRRHKKFLSQVDSYLSWEANLKL